MVNKVIKSLKLKDRTIQTERPAFVMGIVNVTPDSFWEESRGSFERAMKLVEEGADILDLGAESTRPGYIAVSAEDEINRLVPVINQIRKETDIPISIDTRKASVMAECYKVGADILNDVSALEDDKDMAKTVAELGIPVILMHRFLGEESQREPSSKIVQEVSDYLYERVEFAKKSGIKSENIILDTGIGFGKTNEENIELIKCGNNICGKQYPVLMALSRKRIIGFMTDRKVEDRLYGTLAANMIAVMNGAFMVRVHDVAPTIDTLNVMRYINK